MGDLRHGAGERHRPGEARFGGMTVPEPEFADDDGGPDPVLAAALAGYEAGSSSEADVVAALHGRRLMAPLMAVLDSVEEHEGAPGPGEKDSHMATVSLVSPDGRRGLLAFTSVAALAAWDPAARGIPASAARVAAAALEEGADAVLLDLGGPVRFALSGGALAAVAAGADWLPAHLDPEVLRAVAGALAGLAALAGHDVLPGGPGSGDIVVVLAPAPGADAAALARSAADALGTDPVLAGRCPGGVGLALAPGSGRMTDMPPSSW